jgi:hypothetical protein
MLRLACLLALASLAACGSDSDPHELTTCVGWVDNLGQPYPGQCETACKTLPQSTGDKCDTTKMLQCAEFNFEGENGCCIEDGGNIKFYECVP